MNRPLKRSFSLKGHRTSISIETSYWQALRDIADHLNLSLAALVSRIDETRPEDAGLSSAVRVWVLDYYRAQASERAQPDQNNRSSAGSSDDNDVGSSAGGQKGGGGQTDNERGSDGGGGGNNDGGGGGDGNDSNSLD